MYLVVIGWLYVVLMMSVVEASGPNGSFLGAGITFILYGALPLSLVVYLMGAPARSKALKRLRPTEAAAGARNGDLGQTEQAPYFGVTDVPTVPATPAAPITPIAASARAVPIAPEAPIAPAAAVASVAPIAADASGQPTEHSPGPR